MTAFPPDMFKQLEGIYRDLDTRLQQINPLCQRSGNCCNFEKVDHRLFATELEMDYLLQSAPLPQVLPTQEICPYLVEGLCSVRDTRMLGCRIYYCDPTYTDKGQDLYEEFLTRIKQLYRKHNCEWSFVDTLKHFRALKAKE